jgi:hypothetical protein
MSLGRLIVGALPLGALVISAAECGPRDQLERARGRLAGFFQRQHPLDRVVEQAVRSDKALEFH